MKACIRRGANQIRGSSVEIIADNQQRLIIDIGLPLDAEENTQDLLPQMLPCHIQESLSEHMSGIRKSVHRMCIHQGDLLNT